MFTFIPRLSATRTSATVAGALFGRSKTTELDHTPILTKLIHFWWFTENMIYKFKPTFGRPLICKLWNSQEGRLPPIYFQPSNDDIGTVFVRISEILQFHLHSTANLLLFNVQKFSKIETRNFVKMARIMKLASIPKQHTKRVEDFSSILKQGCKQKDNRSWSFWDLQRWSAPIQTLSALTSAVSVLIQRCTLSDNFWTAPIQLWSTLNRADFSWI